MPQRPLKPCAAPACGALVRGKRYCANHEHLAEQAKVQADSRRGSSARRGYNYKWQQARKRFLLANPLCVHCQANGRVSAATDVDHIIPHQGDQRRFWDESNWQALCHPCHSAKTAREDSGFGNAARSQGGGGSKV